MILALLIMSVAHILADHRVAHWHAEAIPGGAIATDCDKCSGDVGVLLECDKGASVARVRLKWAPAGAVRKGGHIKVKFDIDGIADTRQAAVSLHGLWGEAPVVAIGFADPLFQRLEAGRILRLSAGGKERRVPLAGSAAALKIFTTACR